MVAGIRSVFATKSSGTALLTGSAASTLQPLAAIKLFSSVAATLGGGGQANYAAANAIFNATAEELQNAGLPGLAVGWGAWSGAGMAAYTGEAWGRYSLFSSLLPCCPKLVYWQMLLKQCYLHSMFAGLERMARLGYGSISPAAGMAALSALLAGLAGHTGSCSIIPPPPVLVASVMYWDRLSSGGRMVSELKALQQQHSQNPITAGCTDEGASSAAALPHAYQEHPIAALSTPSAEHVHAAVVEAATAVLGHDPGVDTPLMAAGIDSLGEWHGGRLPLQRCTD